MCAYPVCGDKWDPSSSEFVVPDLVKARDLRSPFQSTQNTHFSWAHHPVDMAEKTETPTPKDMGVVGSNAVDENASGDGVGAESFYIDPVKESKVMRKFDVSIPRLSHILAFIFSEELTWKQFYAIGLLGLFYMAANLDRWVPPSFERVATRPS